MFQESLDKGQIFDEQAQIMAWQKIKIRNELVLISMITIIMNLLKSQIFFSSLTFTSFVPQEFMKVSELRNIIYPEKLN